MAPILNPCQWGPGLSSRRTYTVNLSEANLTEADLTEADLRGAKLSKANL